MRIEKFGLSIAISGVIILAAMIVFNNSLSLPGNQMILQTLMCTVLIFGLVGLFAGVMGRKTTLGKITITLSLLCNLIIPMIIG